MCKLFCFCIQVLQFGIIWSQNWLQFGYNDFRSGYNPNETTITSISLKNKTLGLSWSIPLGSASVSQPLYVKNMDMIFIGTEGGMYYGINGTSGSIVWSAILGYYVDVECKNLPKGQLGLTGTAHIDLPSSTLFVVDGLGILYRLNLNNGKSYSSI